MPSDRESVKLTVTLTPGLARALDEYASTYHVNKSQLIRLTLAERIKYDIFHDPQPVRPGRYDNKTQAHAAKHSQDSTRNKKVRAIRLALRDKEKARILDQFITD